MSLQIIDIYVVVRDVRQIAEEDQLRKNGKAAEKRGG